MKRTVLPLLFAGLVLAGSTAALNGGDSSEFEAKFANWMAKVDEKFQRLEAESQELRIENSQLRAENEQLRADFELLRAENEHMRADFEHLKAENVHLQSSRVARADDTSPLESVVTQMSQRLTEMSAEMQTLKNTHTSDLQALKNANTQQDSAIREAGSSVYVRWGRSTCPNSTSLVYSGFIGGGYYHHSGSAPNPLCLTRSPVLSDHNIPGEHSELYGAEYETWDAHYQKDPVCAVCRSQRPTTIMMAGTNVCMDGWTVEYSGFLMGNHYSYAGAMDFICVDSAMENRVGGDPNQNGMLLHYTTTVCGSLPCSPYVNNKAVTCVVCSQ